MKLHEDVQREKRGHKEVRDIHERPRCSIMFRSAFLAATLMSSLSFTPSLRTLIPVVAKKRLGTAISGCVK